MRHLIALTFALLTFTSINFAQNAIFLHHSTGGGVYYEGDVEGWISNYNNEHATSFSVTERAYPDSPYPWENYPYDFWNLWVNGSCNSSQSGIECLSSLTQNYKLIIFKHCFPGAAIHEDTGSPDVASDRKSLENYKLQYRALRAVMDSYPNNMFMVWTLAPLHRNATTVEDAARAREFVNWVNNSWLNEDGNSHPNISVFDFYNIVAESNPAPANGRVNCLKYNYEGDHNGDDSHPNYAANQVAGPIFANAIVNCLENVPDIKVENIGITSGSGIFSINVNGGTIELYANVLPANATNKSISWSIISGEELGWLSPDGILHAIRNGVVRVQVSANDGSGVSAYVDVSITNQPVDYIEIRSLENTNTINTDNGTLHLIARAMPEDMDYPNITWSIFSGGEFITVSATGVVTAIADGYAIVLATSKDNPGVTAIYDVFVSNQIIPVESLSIETEGGAAKIDVMGGSLQLRANVVPVNTTSYIEWSIISGEELAWLSPDGILHAIRNGVVRVQVSANDGSGVSAYVDVTITNQSNSSHELSASDIKLIFNENVGLYSLSLNRNIDQVKIRMYDMSGKLVWMEDIFSAVNYIPQQKQGVYILKIEQNRQQVTKKIVYRP
jgi:hypothetical protein